MKRSCENQTSWELDGCNLLITARHRKNACFEALFLEHCFQKNRCVGNAVHVIAANSVKQYLNRGSPCCGSGIADANDQEVVPPVDYGVCLYNSPRCFDQVRALRLQLHQKVSPISWVKASCLFVELACGRSYICMHREPCMLHWCSWELWGGSFTESCCRSCESGDDGPDDDQISLWSRTRRGGSILSRSHVTSKHRWFSGAEFFRWSCLHSDLFGLVFNFLSLII